MKKWLMRIVVGLAVLIAVVAGIGATLPRDHTASRMLHLHRAPQESWSAISQEMSESPVPVDILESDPPRRLVSRVKETETMFGGTWTVVIAPTNDGSTVAITEDGWVANPIFRFVSRFIIGHHKTMDDMLKNVARKLGEEPVLSGQ